MTFASLLIDSVTVFPWTGGADDGYGSVEDAFGAGVATTGRLQQDEMSESLIDRDTRVSRFTLFLPAATAITATSEVEVDAVRYRVDGDPKLVQDASGSHHIEARVERITG